MTARLEDVALDFLRRRLQGESIDDLLQHELHSADKRADFLLFERTVVVEVKSLVDDREAGIRRIIETWRQRPHWPPLKKAEDIHVVLRAHPHGAEINRQLFASALSSVEAQFRKANRQIRATKQLFKVPDALGLLVVLNDAVDVLEPKVLASMIGGLLNKMDKKRKARFPEVEWVLYIDWAHQVLKDGAPQGHPIMSCERSGGDYPEGFDELQRAVLEAWASFLQLPLEDGGLIANPDDLKKLDVVGRRPPTVF